MPQISQILIIALLLVVSCFGQNVQINPYASYATQSKKEGGNFQQMDGPVLAEEAKEEEKRNEQLPSFIVEDFKELQHNQESFKEAESFLISIPAGQFYEFRYKIQSNSNPSLILELFTHEKGDDIAIIKNHDEDSYVEIFASTNLFGSFDSVGKAYARKFVHLGYHAGSELFVRLENKMSSLIVAEVSLSGPPAQIDRFNVVTNSHFSLPAKKLAAIKAEMKEVEDINRFKFKFEWGFLEREEHYEEEMLKLTAVEAFVILATSVVQMYCIRSLVDKNTVI